MLNILIFLKCAGSKDCVFRFSSVGGFASSRLLEYIQKLYYSSHFYILFVAKNNFNQDAPHRLSLDVGDSVIISRESANWYYGYNKKCVYSIIVIYMYDDHNNNNSCICFSIYRNKTQRGIVPKSYIQIVECVLSPKNEYVVKRSEIVDEVTTVLIEWGDLFKKFYLTNHEIFQPIRQKILELIRLRSQILSGNLPVDELKEVKLMITSEIDTGNKLLGECFYINNNNNNI